MPFAVHVPPQQNLKLKNIDPDQDGGLNKDEAQIKLKALGQELLELQELMYAAGQHSLLIVLQGRDTAGKDGTIRRILDFVNVQGTQVAPFKVPTPKELSHDFLWRVHAKTPERGSMTLFNRSHYEDVLVVRVHKLVPEATWQARYQHINAFESLLQDANTILVKFMLHISKEEQEKRLLEREKDFEKAWKLSVGDWKEREFWQDYEAAYEEVFHQCSPEPCPWTIVPANKKWFRDLAVFETLVERLRPYRQGWEQTLKLMGETRLKELEIFRAQF
jgi:PPK2 family polyphosphate:nucleotide phosphotransferase